MNAALAIFLVTFAAYCSGTPLAQHTKLRSKREDSQLWRRSAGNAVENVQMGFYLPRSHRETRSDKDSPQSKQVPKHPPSAQPHEGEKGKPSPKQTPKKPAKPGGPKPAPSGKHQKPVPKTPDKSPTGKASTTAKPAHQDIHVTKSADQRGQSRTVPSHRVTSQNLSEQQKPEAPKTKGQSPEPQSIPATQYYKRPEPESGQVAQDIRNVSASPDSQTRKPGHPEGPVDSQYGISATPKPLVPVTHQDTKTDSLSRDDTKNKESKPETEVDASPEGPGTNAPGQQTTGGEDAEPAKGDLDEIFVPEESVPSAEENTTGPSEKEEQWVPRNDTGVPGIKGEGQEPWHPENHLPIDHEEWESPHGTTQDIPEEKLPQTLGSPIVPASTTQSPGKEEPRKQDQLVIYVYDRVQCRDGVPDRRISLEWYTAEECSLWLCRVLPKRVIDLVLRRSRGWDDLLNQARLPDQGVNSQSGNAEEKLEE